MNQDVVLDPRASARTRPTWAQITVWSGLILAVIAGATLAPDVTARLVILTLAVGFVAAAAWRLTLMRARRSPAAPTAPMEDADLPAYTVLVALHHETAVAAQLVRRLDALSYPRDRLQGLILLEADDVATRRAIEAAAPPAWLQVVICPPGEPRTKPRALNLGLMQATGRLITVYDAEDAPDPGQLKAAAARFAADAGGRLACLQAPLRVRPPAPGASRFIGRQFAVEYAALFEVLLPAMARLGLPFPLGGTSNHFRTGVLRAVGGWDAWNVTEDADLGFRLWRNGWRLDVLDRPTWEAPPANLAEWLPQRSRWLKGYMQTWGVHTRRFDGLGWRGVLALVMTLGLSLASAALHAVSIAWLAATVLVALHAGLPPAAPLYGVVVLAVGVAASWALGAAGALRAGIGFRPSDLWAAPAYWSMLSLAFAHAAVRLCVEPFRWDKTPHAPDPEPPHPATGAVSTLDLSGRHPVSTGPCPISPAHLSS